MKALSNYLIGVVSLCFISLPFAFLINLLQKGIDWNGTTDFLAFILPLLTFLIFAFILSVFINEDAYKGSD